jgi:hypothetical protein
MPDLDALLKFLEPLLLKFAEGASALAIVLASLLAVTSFALWRKGVVQDAKAAAEIEYLRADILRLRDKLDAQTEKVFILAHESNKAGMAMSTAVNTGNREARREYDALRALLSQGHRVEKHLKKREG